MPSRRIMRDVNEAARDVARALAKTEAFERSRRYRKRVEMLFAHLKRILRLGRLRLRRPMRRARRVHPCCNRAEFTPAFEAGCSTAASRRCMSCVVRDTGRCPLRASLLIKGRMVRTVPRSRGSGLAALIADFCNKICTTRTRADPVACPLTAKADKSGVRRWGRTGRSMSATGGS